MNVFEGIAVLTPLAGAIAGGVSVKASGTVPHATGIVLGLMIGLVFTFFSLRFTALMLRVPGVSKVEKLSRFAWLASLAGVLVPMISPFAAWESSAFIVGRLFRS
jgi:hypothetical protein